MLTMPAQSCELQFLESRAPHLEHPLLAHGSYLCPPIHPTSHSPQDAGTSCPYLILLLEAIAFRRLHLVDVLQEVGHAHGRVQLPRVVRGALAATLPPRGAPQEAAGLIDHTAALVTCTREGQPGTIRAAKPLAASPSPPHTHRGVGKTHPGDVAAAGPLWGPQRDQPSIPLPPSHALCSSSYTTKPKMSSTAF